MLTVTGALRTFLIWLTLFFAWSAYVLWHYGELLLRFIMSDSHLFAYELAVRTVQGDMLPPGTMTFLMALLTLTAGAVLSVLTLLCWNYFLFACLLPVLAGEWLLKRAGFLRKKPA